jgi:hypothetical protein
LFQSAAAIILDRRLVDTATGTWMDVVE